MLSSQEEEEASAVCCQVIFAFLMRCNSHTSRQHTPLHRHIARKQRTELEAGWCCCLVSWLALAVKNSLGPSNVVAQVLLWTWKAANISNAAKSFMAVLRLRDCRKSMYDRWLHLPVRVCRCCQIANIYQCILTHYYFIGPGFDRRRG